MSAIEHILITAGGTVESIDGVRKISNTSTGNLCACIYEALADYVTETAEMTGGANREFLVHYVVSETAVRPQMREGVPLVFYPVSDVRSVEIMLKKVMSEYAINYVIHGMAVSDFTKDYVIEREALVGELADTLEQAAIKELSGDALRALLRQVLAAPARQLDASAKVRSDADLVLAMKRTPKLIDTIKTCSPNAYLVAFKLLKGVSEEHLVHVASELSEKSGCDLVVANDLKKIRTDTHEGLLVRDRKVIGSYHTKREIARGIIRHMLESNPVAR